MNIFLNGREKTLENGTSLEKFLECHNLKSGEVVVELNRVIVSRETYAQVILKNNDSLEILRFVGGG